MALIIKYFTYKDIVLVNCLNFVNGLVLANGNVNNSTLFYKGGKQAIPNEITL